MYIKAVLQGIQQIAILADVIGKSSELPPAFLEIIQIGYEFNVKMMESGLRRKEYVIL